MCIFVTLMLNGRPLHSGNSLKDFGIFEDEHVCSLHCNASWMIFYLCKHYFVKVLPLNLG